jgi:hypothetical protein
MRHSVDFGFPVRVMTQVISCQLFDCLDLLGHYCLLHASSIRTLIPLLFSNSTMEMATSLPACRYSLVNLSFAVRVSEPVTPIFVPPVEMPAPCHVRLGKTTLKPCESFAVCRTRLSLPYVLRSTSLLRQHGKSTQHAKVALDRFKTGRTELRAVAVIALHHFMS